MPIPPVIYNAATIAESITRSAALAEIYNAETLRTAREHIEAARDHCARGEAPEDKALAAFFDAACNLLAFYEKGGE